MYTLQIFAEFVEKRRCGKHGNPRTHQKASKNSLQNRTRQKKKAALNPRKRQGSRQPKSFGSSHLLVRAQYPDSSPLSPCSVARSLGEDPWPWRSKFYNSEEYQKGKLLSVMALQPISSIPLRDACQASETSESRAPGWKFRRQTQTASGSITVTVTQWRLRFRLQGWWA